MDETKKEILQRQAIEYAYLELQERFNVPETQDIRNVLASALEPEAFKEWHIFLGQFVFLYRSKRIYWAKNKDFEAEYILNVLDGKEVNNMKYVLTDGKNILSEAVEIEDDDIEQAQAEANYATDGNVFWIEAK